LLLLVISGNIHPHPSPTFDNLSICHINCRSLLAFDKEAKCNTMELEEIESVLCTGKFDIICMSETWLSSKTPDDEIKIENYTLHRHDRDSDCGYGGVCIYVSNSLKSKRNLTDESDGIELIWIEIQIEKLNILRERPFNLEGGVMVFF
jgi:exonuclease III